MSDITRRDFLNGVALAIAAGLTPAAQLAAQPLRYPPALTGMRGHHRRLVRGRPCAARGQKLSPRRHAGRGGVRLVVVGGGISGLAAAWFYRERANAGARILILDNHDDFGGHAKRNEFRLDGRLILGYGGSESLQSPQGAVQRRRQGPAEGPRRRPRRASMPPSSAALSLARAVARRVLSARGVRARHARHRRPDDDGRRRPRPRPAATPSRSASSSPSSRSRPEARTQLIDLFEQKQRPAPG